MLSSVIGTINNELSKKENKEVIDSLYNVYLDPYVKKLYMLVILIVMLALLSFLMNIYCSYSIFNNSHCLYKHASI
jgi:hypothetical protein